MKFQYFTHFLKKVFLSKYLSPKSFVSKLKTDLLMFLFTFKCLFLFHGHYSSARISGIEERRVPEPMSVASLQFTEFTSMHRAESSTAIAANSTGTFSQNHLLSQEGTIEVMEQGDRGHTGL